jgi:hypothetical protein
MSRRLAADSTPSRPTGVWERSVRELRLARRDAQKAEFDARQKRQRLSEGGESASVHGTAGQSSVGPSSAGESAELWLSQRELADTSYDACLLEALEAVPPEVNLVDTLEASGVEAAGGEAAESASAAPVSAPSESPAASGTDRVVDGRRRRICRLRFRLLSVTGAL